MTECYPLYSMLLAIGQTKIDFFSLGKYQLVKATPELLKSPWISVYIKENLNRRYLTNLIYQILSNLNQFFIRIYLDEKQEMMSGICKHTEIVWKLVLFSDSNVLFCADVEGAEESILKALPWDKIEIELGKQMKNQTN